jgi:hypothetical protein
VLPQGGEAATVVPKFGCNGCWYLRPLGFGHCSPVDRGFLKKAASGRFHTGFTGRRRHDRAISVHSLKSAELGQTDGNRAEKLGCRREVNGLRDDDSFPFNTCHLVKHDLRDRLGSG